MKRKQIKKVTADDFRENYLLSNGMVHLAYKAGSVDDVVSPYSQKEYEVLSPQFSSYVDSVMPTIPLDYPVVTEISGHEFNEEEKRASEDAVWNYYHLKLSKLLSEKKNELIRMGWFALSMIFASCLLFFVKPETSDVVSNIAYLPFWFFGYRLITYFVLEYNPQMKEIRHCRQIASMKLVFTGKEIINEVPEDKVESYSREYDENYACREDTDINEVMKEYFINDGTAEITCSIKNVDDVVQPTSVEDYEIACDALTDYISGAIPFIPDDCPVCLKIEGPLSKSEEEASERAIRTHFTLKAAEYTSEVKKSIIRIAAFTVCFILSILLLCVSYKVQDVAVYEFITMLFWFFGDYLVEFVMLELKETIEIKNKYLQMLNMDIKFIK